MPIRSCDKVSLMVTCAFGMEAIVRRELEGLGFSGLVGADGKIEFEAPLSEVARLNISLRVADRVLVKLAEFPTTDFDQLFDGVKAVAWEEWLPKDAKITVTAKAVRSTHDSVRSCQAITKKAIVERLKDKWQTDWLPETGAEFTIQAAVLKDVAQITLDTTGYGLHRRGYRQEKGEVPLRENLGAALVLLSFWNKERILIDPMCGSGTILIEAAMIARHIAPGLKRTFSAENWPVLEKKIWDDARASAREAILPSGGLKIFGSDIDPERIRDAQANASMAGVGEDVVFEVKDIKALWIDKPYGVVISNPPYGVKLGSLKELTEIYVSINNTFKKKTGWSLYILTADKRFTDFFKRAKPDKVRKLFNGTIEVNYYQYFGDRPPRAAV